MDYKSLSHIIDDAVSFEILTREQAENILKKYIKEYLVSNSITKNIYLDTTKTTKTTSLPELREKLEKAIPQVDSKIAEEENAHIEAKMSTTDCISVKNTKEQQEAKRKFREHLLGCDPCLSHLIKIS